MEGDMHVVDKPSKKDRIAGGQEGITIDRWLTHFANNKIIEYQEYV